MALSGHNNVVPTMTINFSVWVWYCPLELEASVTCFLAHFLGAKACCNPHYYQAHVPSSTSVEGPFFLFESNLSINSANIPETGLG